LTRIRIALLGLTATAALTACTPPAVPAATPVTPSPRTLQMDLPVIPTPELTGTDAGLITEPAPGTPASTSPTAPARPVVRVPASPARPTPPQPAPRPAAPAAEVAPAPAPVEVPAPVDVEPAPASEVGHPEVPPITDPAAHPCFRGDEECYLGTDAIPGFEQPTEDIAEQLPEERIGGYRCPDPEQVIVSVDPDVCGDPASLP